MEGINPDNDVAMADVLPLALHMAPPAVNDNHRFPGWGHEVLAKHASSPDHTVVPAPGPVFTGNGLSHSCTKKFLIIYNGIAYCFS